MTSCYKCKTDVDKETRIGVLHVIKDITEGWGDVESPMQFCETCLLKLFIKSKIRMSRNVTRVNIKAL